MVVEEIRQLVNRTPVFTLANGLTLFRLFLLPPIYILLRQGGSGAEGLAVLCVAVGWLTDGLDGYAARRLRQVSELGKILDPLIDKIFVLSLLLFLVVLRDFPVWVLAVVIPRDILILGFGFYLARRRKTVEKSGLWGKLTTNVLMACAVVFLLRWHPVIPFLLGLAVFLMVISTWSYGRIFVRKLQETN